MTGLCFLLLNKEKERKDEVSKLSNEVRINNYFVRFLIPI